MTTRQRRRVSLIFASLTVAAVMVLTLIRPIPAASARAHPAQPDNLPPLLTFYGAIASSHDGKFGKARREQSKRMAELLAMQRCAVPSCRVVSSFTKCGAVAHDGATYHGGHGPTRRAAEEHAVANLGGGWPVTWVCT